MTGGPRGFLGWRSRLADYWRFANQIGLVQLLLLAGLATNMYSGHAGDLGWPIAPDRLFLGSALLLVALAPGFWSGAPRVLTLCMTGFVVVIISSMAAYGNLTNATSVFALLDRTVIPFLLFLAAPVLFDTVVRRKALLVVVAGLGVYLGYSAIAEIVQPRLVWPSYVTNPEVGLGYGRARGPFVSPEGMGAALAICAAAAITGWAKSTRGRPWWAIAAALSSVGVVLSLTRAIWLAALVSALVCVLLSRAARPIAARVAGFALATGAAILAFNPTVRASLSTRTSDPNSVYDRLGSNDAALRLLYERPLTGIGWRRFYPYGSEWVRQADSYPINNTTVEVHNVLLSRAAELGIPAAALFVLIIAMGPLRPIFGLRVMRPDAWCVLGVSTFTMWLTAGLFGPMATPFPNYLAWLLAGTAFGVFQVRSVTAISPDDARINATNPVESQGQR